MLETKNMQSKFDLNVNKLMVPVVVMLAFLTLGTVLWRSTGEIMGLFFFGYIGYANLGCKQEPCWWALLPSLVRRTCRSKACSSDYWEAYFKPR